MKLILASNSPRRKDILKQFNYNFDICVSSFAEHDAPKHPVQTAKDNAFGKAKDVFNNLDDKSALVLGADTVVYIDGVLLGKPTSPQHAKKMLKNLSGKTHSVVTGFALVGNGIEIVDFEQSYVTFNELSDKLIDEYVDSGSPLDKAGAYGIQDDYPLVKEFKGSMYNVIGLPIEKIKPILDKYLK